MQKIVVKVTRTDLGNDGKIWIKRTAVLQV